MIGKLKGNIDVIIDKNLVIDVNGVGYEVICPENLLVEIEEKQDISLYIETILREDSIKLYGFQTLEERKFFGVLQTVQGVGAKLALTIIGFFPIGQLIEFITMEDEKSICVIPGVGPKVAKRIISELKDEKSHTTGQKENKIQSKRDDVISALINLGYSRADAINLFSGISNEIDDNILVEDLIKLALRGSKR